MVDAERVLRLLERLDHYLAELDRLAGCADLDDPDRLASVKYHFIVAIECCLDLANHVIAAERLRAPHDYADSFRSLEEAGLLERRLAERLQQAARFRNRLVHVYWEVDDALVSEYLASDRDVLAAFARALAARVSGAEQDGS